MESKTQSSGHEGRKQKLTEERGNSKNQKTDKPKKSQNGESRCQSDKQDIALRRSTRKRTTTKRLQLNVVPGKRYADKEVEIMPENEQSESESDHSFVTVGENSFVEVSTEVDESDPFFIGRKLGRRKTGGTISAHVWSWLISNTTTYIILCAKS